MTGEGDPRLNQQREKGEMLKCDITWYLNVSVLVSVSYYQPG